MMIRDWYSITLFLLYVGDGDGGGDRRRSAYIMLSSLSRWPNHDIPLSLSSKADQTEVF